MKTKNQSSLPSKYWLIIVIVICVILMGVERITGGNGPISFVANYTVIPMQKGIGYVGRYMNDLSDNFETLQDMKKENRKLQSKVDDLTIDNTRLRQDQYELERLRELYKLDENYSDYKKVGAHVISNNGSNWFSDFTIDKGKKDGIKKNCNVLAGSGLVGIVTEVGPHYARVRSIIDDESNISAMLLSTSDTCVVRGDLKQMENGRIRFEKLANKIAKNAPIAVRACKKAINEGLDLPMDEAIVVEEKLFGSCFKTHDQIEGMDAFLTKRKEKNFINA